MSSRPLASRYKFRPDIDEGWFRVYRGADYCGDVYRVATGTWDAWRPGAVGLTHLGEFRTRLDAAHALDTA